MAWRKNDLSNSAVEAVSYPCQLTGYLINNPNSAEVFVQFFDSSSVTVGTTTPVLSVKVGSSGTVQTNDIKQFFTNSIKVAATTTEEGNTAPTSAVSVTLWYK